MNKDKGFSSIIILIVAVLFVGIAGTGYYFSRKSPATNKGQIIKTQVVKQEIAGNDKVGDNLKLPANFPKNIPVYPGAPITTINFDGKSEKGGLTQETRDDMVKVAEWYKTEAIKLGWTVEISSADSITFKNKQNLLGHLGLTADSGKTDIEFATYSKEDFDMGNGNKPDTNTILQQQKQSNKIYEETTGKETGIDFNENIPDKPLPGYNKQPVVNAQE